MSFVSDIKLSTDHEATSRELRQIREVDHSTCCSNARLKSCLTKNSDSEISL